MSARATRWTYLAALTLSLVGSVVFAVAAAAAQVITAAALPEANLLLRLADAGAGYLLAGVALVLTYRLAIRWAADAKAFGEERGQMLERVLVALTEQSRASALHGSSIEDLLSELRRMPHSPRGGP